MPRMLTPIGERFGRWTVVADAGVKRFPSGGTASQWLCRCDCGNEKVVLAQTIRNGTSKCCGCDQRANLYGERFGRWTVTGPPVTKGSGDDAKRCWPCLCDCGRTSLISTVQLTSGHSRSCGCLKSDATRAAKTTHGQAGHSSKTAEYRAWTAMKTRCYNKNEPARLLRTVVEEAPIMALELGHESADKFLTDYIGLDLDLVHRVVSWLDLEKPTSATPLDLAVEKANNALNLQGSFAGPGRLPADTDGNGDIITIPMNPTGKGTSASYLALRLKKAGREDLLGQVRDGEIRSIRKAAIEAGIVKDIPTVRVSGDTLTVIASLDSARREHGN
jgi:hypothetical protein